MSGRRTALAVLGVGILGSQAGHLLAYELRFGSAAQHLQSSGAHAYFPLLAKTALGAVAAAFVGAIFLIGLARVLAGRSRMRTGSAHGYIEVLAALFTIQLACFITQEVGEALVAGTAVDSAAHLLLWGSLGQLPVETWPSDANFILFRPLHHDADKVWSGLLERSVLIRNCASWDGLQGCLRVTIGRPDENDRFLTALKESL